MKNIDATSILPTKTAHPCRSALPVSRMKSAMLPSCSFLLLTLLVLTLTTVLGVLLIPAQTYLHNRIDRCNPSLLQNRVNHVLVQPTWIHQHMLSVNHCLLFVPWQRGTHIKSNKPKLFYSSYNSICDKRNYSVLLSDNHIINLKSTSTTLVFVTFLTLFGDVQTNPGTIKYPCPVCSKPVANNHKALPCDICHKFTHIKCDGLSANDFTRL